MRDQTPDSIRETTSPIGEAGSLMVKHGRSPISETNFNIIVKLHPTEGTHWVLVIRREGGPVYYFDSFDVETPPLFLEEYVDLGSDERIQQYDESYCGAYCLYMIYLIDRGFRINIALNILVNQCKYPGIYNECFCLGCNVNQGRNEVLGTPTCFADDNDNVIVNDNDIVNVNPVRRIPEILLRSRFFSRQDPGNTRGRSGDLTGKITGNFKMCQDRTRSRISRREIRDI